MRAFVATLLLWSVIVSIWILFVPTANGDLLSCMRPVGRSAACDAQQEAVNQIWWDYHTLPIMLTIASGHVGIIVVRLAGRRRSHSTPPSIPPPVREPF